MCLMNQHAIPDVADLVNHFFLVPVEISSTEKRFFFFFFFFLQLTFVSVESGHCLSAIGTALLYASWDITDNDIIEIIHSEYAFLHLGNSGALWQQNRC